MINDVTPPERLSRPKPKRIEPLDKPHETPLHERAKAADPTFKTPEEAAAEESSAPVPTVVEHQASKSKPLQSSKLPKKIFKRWHFTRKQQIIGGIVAVLLVCGIGAGWMLTHHKRNAVAVSTHKKATIKKVAPPVIYSTLTGLPVADASVNQRTVTGVMIENSLDARPQSGLGDAGVVFEAVAEGGVTRFLALFQDTAPANVGPIRSARPYYVSWDMGFDAAYAHVGGSTDGLADIASWGTHDMNQFYNSKYYHRTSDRAAPHNVYTSIATLNQLEAAKGFTSTYTGFTRATKEAPAAAPIAASIDFHLSGYTYDPHYDYVAATNSYNRSEAGQPHVDANTGKQISPKVVIAIVVPLARGALDSTGAYYSNYTTIGSGQAYIFQNGTLTTGTWAKASNAAQITFTDANGQAIPLNPGQTWISAVSSTSAVVYK